jgi:hypothetical protein
MLAGISSEEQSNSTDTKNLSIAICFASLKLLKGSRDIAEARKEDVHDRDWGGSNWLGWEGMTVVVCCHYGKRCTWTAKQKIAGRQVGLEFVKLKSSINTSLGNFFWFSGDAKAKCFAFLL